MLHTCVPAAFQHVGEPDHVRLDVGERVRQGVAYSGLRGQVNDAVEGLFREESLHPRLVSQICHDETKSSLARSTARGGRT